jgi:hypothetical protein
MTRSSARHAITRVEVLVIIAIIVVLLALVPSAIRTARESARRTQCSNNLQRVALGLRKYHDIHTVFPMGAMHAGPNPGGDPPVTAALGPSWWFGILPLLHPGGSPWVFVCREDDPKRIDNYVVNADQLMYDKIIESQRPGQDVRCEFCAKDVDDYLTAQRYTFNDGENVGQLWVWCIGPEYMRCHSSPLGVCETSFGPTLPSYVGIAGGCDIDPRSEDYQARESDPSGLVAPRAARVYHNKYKGTGAAAGGIVTSSGLLPPCQHIRLQDCADGTSNTMIVAEQSDWLHDRDLASTCQYHGDPGWTRMDEGNTGLGGGWLSGTRRVDPVPQVTAPGGPPAIWGADCWNITTVRYPPNSKRVMGVEGTETPPLPGCSENHGINNPLQSPHPGGLLVGMADGSVRFIRETAGLEILLRLAIRDDGASPPLP